MGPPRFSFSAPLSSSLISSVGKESACNAGDPDSIPGLGRSAGEGTGYPLQYSWASFVVQLVKNPLAMWETWVRSLGSIPGLGRSPGEGKGYPLQYSGLENSKDYTVHGVAESARLSYFHFHLSSSGNLVSMDTNQLHFLKCASLSVSFVFQTLSISRVSSTMFLCMEGGTLPTFNLFVPR